MIYTEKIQEALRFIARPEIHGSTTDKAGTPYILHPFYLATQMPDEDSALTALLHDVAEDVEGYTPERLQAELGLPDAVVGALHLLCHDKSMPYADYVRAIAEGVGPAGVLARRVKLADLRHNMMVERQPAAQQAAARRRVAEKYQPAYALLTKVVAAD